MKKTKEMSWRERRRRQAWELKEKGWSQSQIAEAVGVTDGAVSQWFKKAREQGPEEGLKDHPASGPSRRLSENQLARLSELLEQGAEAYGFVGERWTGRRVGKVIKREFGVSYSIRQVQRMLKEMGYSVQKPQRQAAQRNEEAIKQFQTEVIPEIKKK